MPTIIICLLTIVMMSCVFLSAGCATTEKPDYIGQLPSYAKKIKKSVDIEPVVCQDIVLTIKEGK